MRFLSVLSRLLVTAVGAMTVAAACSSSTKATSSNTTGSPPKAAPIEIGTIASIQSQVVSNSEFAEGVDAAVKSMNASGGINGRPVKLNICDDHLLAEAAAACLRSLSSNPADVALVGGTTVYADNSANVLNAARIPWVGAYGVGVWQNQSPTVTLASPGANFEWPAAGVAAVQQGYKRISLMHWNQAPAMATASVIKAAIQAAGGTVVKDIPFDPTTPDLTPLVAQAASGNPDAVLTFMNNNQAAVVVSDLHKEGYQGKVVLSASGVTTSYLQQLGSGANGLLLSSPTAPPFVSSADTSWMGRYRSDLATYSPKTNLNSYSVSGWMAAQIFKTIVSGLPTIDRASILTKMKQESSMDTGGLTPTLNFASPGPIKGSPNAVNLSVAVERVTNGIATWDGKFLDVARFVGGS